MKLLNNLFVAILLGAVLALCLHPFQFGYLVLLPLALVVSRGGFRYGFFFGIGFWTLHLIWLPESFSGQFGPWGAAIFVPLIFLKAAMWAVVWALSVHRPWRRVGIWVVLDWLTETGDIAFPWGFTGYSLVEAPGRILASLGGIYLLSAIVLALAVLLHYKKYWALAIWALIWLAPLPQIVPGDHTALLVQGAIDPFRKMQGLAKEDIEVYTGITLEGLRQNPKVELVVFPETAINRLSAELISGLGDRKLISGMWNNGVNSAVAYDRGQIRATYGKNRLVPFTEKFPFHKVLDPVYLFFLKKMGFSGLLGDVSSGDGFKTLGEVGSFICYESVFPSVARTLTQNGAQVLELGSNDAWYGPTFGAAQHFQMGRMRAVETGRWLIRVGNNGVTAFIDPLGRIASRIPQHTPGYLVGQYSLRTNITPYVRFGDWVIWFTAAFVLVGLIQEFVDRRKRKSGLIVGEALASLENSS